MTSTREGAAKAHTRFRIETDDWGIVEIHCAKATLTPEPASDDAE